LCTGRTADRYLERNWKAGGDIGDSLCVGEVRPAFTTSISADAAVLVFHGGFTDGECISGSGDVHTDFVVVTTITVK